MKISLSIVKTNLIYGVLLLILMSAAACSSDSGGSSDAGAAPGPGPASSNITVAANPTSLTPNGTSVITATIRDSNGNLVPDGTTVIFSLNTVASGTLTNTTVTTTAGIATTTFAANSVPGSVTITATSGGNSNIVSLSVGTVSAGSIQFVSATPKILGIRGSGQSETSVIQFLVIDVNGNPVNGAIVDFVMTGPNGGEFIGDIDTTPNLASAATASNGIAFVLLHSGTIAGPVNIAGSTTIANGPIFSSATPLSIGGGVPSAAHFSLAPVTINLAGFKYYNLQTIVSAYLADRFGNYNVLDATSVSFYTEAGAIDAQGITGVLVGPGETGIAATEGNTGAANVKSSGPSCACPRRMSHSQCQEIRYLWNILTGATNPLIAPYFHQAFILFTPEPVGALSSQRPGARRCSLMRTMTDCLPALIRSTSARIAPVLSTIISSIVPSVNAMEEQRADMLGMYFKERDAVIPGNPEGADLKVLSIVLRTRSMM